MKFRGLYNPDFVYMINDVVHFDGSSWIASKVISLRTPPPGDGWHLMAARGIDGQRGSDGRDGSVGPIGHGVSAGGQSGEVLVKASASDYATQWTQLTPQHIGASQIGHTHGVEDIQNLESRFAGVSPKNHAHTVDQVLGLNDILNTKASAKHSHLLEDISFGPMSVQSLTVSDGLPAIYLRNNAHGDTASIETDRGNLNVLSSGGVSIVINGNNVANISKGGLSVDGSVVGYNVRCSNLFLNGPITPKTGNGEKGQLCWDSEYLYLCIGKGIWKKIRLEELA